MRCTAGSERVSAGGCRGGLGGGSEIRERDLVYVPGAVSADLGMGSPSEGLTEGAKQVADAFLLGALGDGGGESRASPMAAGIAWLYDESQSVFFTSICWQAPLGATW